MGFAQDAASAAAAAALCALQRPDCAAECAKNIAAVVPAAAHCSVTLNCSPASGTRLCSGNLLGAGPGTAQASLVAGYTLAATCIKERKAKMLKNVGDASQYSMDDVSAIVADSGCSAILCLPLLPLADSKGGSCSAEGAPCLGALTVGFRTTADITSTSLKGVLLLAHSLAKEQRDAMEILATLVSSLLLPPAVQPGGEAGSQDPGSDGWASDLDAAGWDPSDSEEGEEGADGWHEGDAGRAEGSRRRMPAGGTEQRGAGDAAPGGSGGRGAAGGGGGGPAQRPFSLAVLTFRSPAREQQFAGYHAQHMQRVDTCAYFIAVVFFVLEAFVPGTPFFLFKRMGWSCLLGFGAMLPSLLMLTKGTRGWFAAHRDLLLAFSWAYCTLWMTSVANYMHILDHTSFRNPLYLQSFGWMTVVGLAFQMRFRFQVVAALLAYATNTQLLPSICQTFYADLAPRHCLTLGLLRVFLHGVLLPLACCYVFETHARRLFMRAEAGGWRGAWSAPRGRRLARGS